VQVVQRGPSIPAVALVAHARLSVGEGMRLVREPDAGDRHVRLCVQRRLVCSAGDRPAGVRVRCPVVGIAGWRETKTLKPIDKISLGEITSHRAVTKVNVEVASKMKRPEGRARNREGEGNINSRKLTDAAIALRRGGSDGTLARTC
jgi:hypothetical protein